MKTWLDNKTIAIVGNSKSLFDTEYGPEIDLHDVVIRINRSASICFKDKYKNLKLNQGVKTDIWAFSFADTMIKELIKHNSITKKLIQMNPKTKNKLRYSFGFEAIQSSDIELLNEKINLHYNSNINPKNKIIYKASTGLRVLEWVSTFNPISVNIYGFDWKKSPTFYDTSKETRFGKVKNGHNFLLEMDYCINVFQNQLGYTFVNKNNIDTD
jgi:hypothetical protein